MSAQEFRFIADYFQEINGHEGCQPGSQVLPVGIGDDGAVLDLKALLSYGLSSAQLNSASLKASNSYAQEQSVENKLIVAADTMVEGTHFLPGACPKSIGYKSLVVNLSDLAAMAATPLAFTLCLTLPHSDEAWLSSFSQGLQDAATAYGVSLIGGDTTRGPLSISIQVLGLTAQPLTRSSAEVGDSIYVTGPLGDAAGGLAYLLGASHYQLGVKAALKTKASTALLMALEFPQPRLECVRQLRHFMKSGIDISDGLLQDLEHLCHASGVTAKIMLNQLPLSDELQECYSESQALQFALVGGEDYQLLFTSDPTLEAELEKVSQELRLPLYKIGHIVSKQSSFAPKDEFPVKVDGYSEESIIEILKKGFLHFEQ